MSLSLYIIIAIFVCVGAIILQILIERSGESAGVEEQEPDFEEIVSVALLIGALWIVALPLIILLLIQCGLISLCEHLYNILKK